MVAMQSVYFEFDSSGNQLLLRCETRPITIFYMCNYKAVNSLSDISAAPLCKYEEEVLDNLF